jgi:adenylate cyclase
MATTRRLTAILAADVAGYSRLMGADEEGTHERLRANIGQLFHPKIREHKGRIIKNTGDGLLAEFASVVDAVRCAAEVQRGMVDREPRVPCERRIRFRIGVNIGDVIADGDDIFGDGVNVAARLETIAEAGGICISGTVHDQIRDKLPYHFEDMGEQAVKNIARPVRAYALRPAAVADLPVSSVPIAVPRRRAILAGLAAAPLAALIVAAITWWSVWPTAKPPSTSPGPGAPAATAMPQSVAVPRLSIVVLPFANLGNDPTQQYFADGITEDLTTDLSQGWDMFVISRNTAFTYKDKPINAKQIGHELGVRYVLEGSVQRSGNQVRVNAQLIDAETDTHLWAQRFDRDMSDMFVLQNDITRQIAGALNLRLIAKEAARPTDHPDALDYIFRGRAAFDRAESPDNFSETISLFEHALSLDPQSVEAKSRLALALANRVLEETSKTRATDIERAEALIEQALAMSPQSALVHFVNAQILRASARCEEAIPEYETVLAINRNWASAIADIGHCKTYTGTLDEVIPLEQEAIRLSPRDPFIGFWYLRIGIVHLLQSHTDEAMVWLKKARSAKPTVALIRLWLASAYALKDDPAAAAAELAEAGRLDRNYSYVSVAKASAAVARNVKRPAIRAFYEDTFIAGLRKAGVPEK